MRSSGTENVAVVFKAHVLVVACSASRAYAGALWVDVVQRCIYSGMHICMVKVPLWGIESSVQGPWGMQVECNAG